METVTDQLADQKIKICIRGFLIVANEQKGIYYLNSSSGNWRLDARSVQWPVLQLLGWREVVVEGYLVDQKIDPHSFKVEKVWPPRYGEVSEKFFSRCV